MRRCFTYGAVLALSLSLGLETKAQQAHHQCGTTHEDQLLIKQRMVENRRNEAQIYQEYMLRRDANSTGIFYVPIQFHIAGTQTGEGYIPLTDVLGALCKLNDDYRDQNIQFYLNGISYINNNFLFNHGNSSRDNTASYFMSLFRVPNVVNVFIGRNVTSADQFLAYYSPGLDIIYSFKTGIGPGNPTLTHEMGHLLTLPHTFFGWEGTDFNNQAINNKAPDAVGGVLVERVARGGGNENCQVAADGFCDTPADYHSDRIGCPFPFQYFDQDSVPVTPDSENFMSYFNDNCIRKFSEEQKQAMIRDFLSRGFDRFPTPAQLEVTSAPSLTWPKSDAPALYPSGVEFRWEAATGADRYLVTIERTVNGVFAGLETQFITFDTKATVALTANRTYRWRVQPLNSIDVCNNFGTANETFQTFSWAVNTESLQSLVSDSKLYPNPLAAGQSAVLDIQASQDGTAYLRIFNALGQEMMMAQRMELNAGANNQMLELSALLPGLYIVQIETSQGERHTHRLVIQR